ncbi:glycine zipper domain-containing protein [Gilvimarinus sp. F26214L]|uniref:glycine zipper domain-containing protein n=1 Tax=Gilvimarinus sp. DZF01 TaxID=3461371 RepID=UPI004045E0C2
MTSPYSETPAGAPVTEKTVAAAHRSIDALAERASRSEQALREAATSSAGKYTETQELVRTRVSDNLDRARDYVREHPITAAGAAFAAGALMAALFSGRR